MLERGRRFVGVALVATVIGGALIWSPDPVAAQTVREVFEKVAPTVVVIRARGREVTTGGQSRFAETGSGVLISRDGRVMTAAHVVHAMDEIAVQFLGGETVAARVVASEPAADLSLLQLERVPPGAKVAAMADSNTVHVGDPVIIVGAPYGLSYSLSAGYISARWAPNTVYKTMPLAEFFQTTATINTGNSGGPMFAMNGEVIGIVSHNISKSGGSEGLGFVVTLNTAKQLLLEKRSFWAGLEGLMLDDDLADLLNLPPRASGYIVKTVAKDSPGGIHRAARRHAGREDQRAGRAAWRGYHPDGRGDLDVGGQPAQDPRGIERVAPGRPSRSPSWRKGQVLELAGRAP